MGLFEVLLYLSIQMSYGQKANMSRSAEETDTICASKSLELTRTKFKSKYLENSRKKKKEIIIFTTSGQTDLSILFPELWS